MSFYDGLMVASLTLIVVVTGYGEGVTQGVIVAFAVLGAFGYGHSLGDCEEGGRSE